MRESIKKIDGMMRQKRQFVDSDRGQNYEYVNSKISTTVFDGIVSSGGLTYFSSDAQFALDMLFFHIKEHNEKIEKVEELYQRFRIESSVPEGKELLVQIIQEIHIIDKIISDKIREIGKMDAGFQIR